jgi:hypothetical protein
MAAEMMPVEDQPRGTPPLSEPAAGSAPKKVIIIGGGIAGLSGRTLHRVAPRTVCF